jgi:hypothetical protein
MKNEMVQFILWNLKKKFLKQSLTLVEKKKLIFYGKQKKKKFEFLKIHIS